MGFLPEPEPAANSSSVFEFGFPNSPEPEECNVVMLSGPLLGKEEAEPVKGRVGERGESSEPFLSFWLRGVAVGDIDERPLESSV